MCGLPSSLPSRSVSHGPGRASEVARAFGARVPLRRRPHLWHLPHLAAVVERTEEPLRVPFGRRARSRPLWRIRDRPKEGGPLWRDGARGTARLGGVGRDGAARHRHLDNLLHLLRRVQTRPQTLPVELDSGHQKLQVRDGARIAVPAAVTRGKPARLGVEVIQQPVDAALEPLVAAQSERRPVQLVSAVRHLVEVPAREEAEGSRRGGISGTRGEQARLAQHRDGVVLCRPALPPVGSSFSRDTKRGEARHRVGRLGGEVASSPQQDGEDRDQKVHRAPRRRRPLRWRRGFGAVLAAPLSGEKPRHVRLTGLILLRLHRFPAASTAQPRVR
mmetsp:Transcript_26641/g.85457  ORF Transcript_26641/g.85457 Transcript_26641/m.85457 type:complete len:332 (+) Transcript_26641:714-1709(+)